MSEGVPPSHPHPLVGDGGVGQPVGVGDAHGVRRQLLSVLQDALYRRAAGAGRVGTFRNSLRDLAGQRLRVVPVVGERDLHLDGLAGVAIAQGVGGAGRALNVNVVGHPLVSEGRVVEPVGVGNARGVRRQRLTYLGGAADGGSAGGRGVGRRSRRHRHRSRAGQCLPVAPVVGEGHPGP